MCSNCDGPDNVNPVEMAERELERVKRVDGYVQNGIKLLGEFAESGVIAADWWNHVNLSTLDMTSISDCVLGQLFAPAAEKAYLAEAKVNYYAYLRSGYDYAIEIIDDLGESVVELGFNTIYGGWDTLKASWKHYIMELRNNS